MSKPGVLGLGVLGAGAVFGFVIGDRAGLAFAAVCLIVGLVLVVASEARGLDRKPVGVKEDSADEPTARVLVLVREVHARPQRAGKFREIHDLNEADLEFEVFINCWLLNEADLSLGIEDVQLGLKGTDGSTRLAEPVRGDMESWCLGKVERVSEEESDLSDRDIRTTRVGVVELNTVEPLECGLPREGWLHFRIRNTTPSDFKTEALELSVRDSLSHTHVGVASTVRHLPGRIWPIPANSVPKATDSKRVSTG